MLKYPFWYKIDINYYQSNSITIIMNKDEILEKYSEYLLENGEEPKSVYAFAKELNMQEEEFYNHYSGFRLMNAELLKKVWDNSENLTRSIEGFEMMPAKEQLLNMYYIFFENLKMNRSLALQILEKKPKLPPTLLLQLKTKFRNFIKTLNFEESKVLRKMSARVDEAKHRAQEEILWNHFISLLVFWRTDDSPGFEKTDVYIEKTIDTGFDIAEYRPLRKVADLGKFLWNEKIHRT